MKRLFVFLFLVLFISAPLSACHWMGKKSGQAVESVKEAPDDFGKGYDEGKESVQDKKK